MIPAGSHTPHISVYYTGTRRYQIAGFRPEDGADARVSDTLFKLTFNCALPTFCSNHKTKNKNSNYQNAEAPPEPQGVAAIVKRELKQRWWLWLAVGFIACTMLALSGMSGHMYKGISDPGMPELAVQQENGAACKESCDSQAQLQGENSVASGSALAADAVNTGSDIVEVSALKLSVHLRTCGAIKLKTHEQKTTHTHRLHPRSTWTRA